MKVTKNGKYFGIFDITCGACECKYEVSGPEDFIFTDEDEEDTIYADNGFVATTHCAYTKCPECLYKQWFAN